MSNFELVTGPASGLKNVRSAAEARATATPVFVDVSEKATTAQVSRAGFNVGEILVRPDVLDGVLGTRPVVRTKVVSQSIVAGTAVARGTAASKARV